MQGDEFESVRVVNQPTAIRLLNLSEKTWERMRLQGKTPPATRISDRRIGYRISDLQRWLDSRREPQTAA